MPNYCDNTIIINGRKDEIKHLYKRLKKHLGKFDLNTQLDKEFISFDLKRKNRNFLGVDWFRVYTCGISNGDIIISGDSAWNPPTKLIENILRPYSTLEASLVFSEGGCDFAGLYNYYKDKSTNEERMSYICGMIEFNSIPPMELFKDEFSDNYESYEEFKNSDFYSYFTPTQLNKIKETYFD